MSSPTPRHDRYLGALRPSRRVIVALALTIHRASAQGISVRDSVVARPNPIAAATREYQRTGVARPVDDGAFVSFPYGHAQPTVTCMPLRACVIELDAGEVVLSTIAGDTQRWEIQLAAAGPDGRTPLVVVKPHDCGITTNLVLATSAGRIYDLTLDSPICPHAGVNPHGAYIRHVRFYYPDPMVRVLRTADSINAPAAAGRSPATAAPVLATIDALNFDYRIERDKRFPWTPAAVFDDGAHCFIKLPQSAAHREAPVLFILEQNGTKALLNYTLFGDTYVTDRVFRTGLLAIGEEGQEYTLRIENRRYQSASDSSRGGW